MSTPASLPYAFVAKIVAADGQHDALAFPDEAARDVHANGAIVEALMANQQLLGAAPEILPADVLASKLP